MEKILVIGAHYDDPELAAGGSMAKWVMEGKKVYKLILTDNETNFSQKKIFVKREKSVKESARSCEVIGCEEVLWEEVKCGKLAYEQKYMQKIEAFIFNTKIDTILIHHLSDVNQDHAASSTLSYVAGRYCDKILTYQSNKYILPTDFYPRYFVDITSTVEKKKKALECYSGDHNRFNSLFNMTIQQNRVWGYQSSMNEKECYAEAFGVIKFVER